MDLVAASATCGLRGIVSEFRLAIDHDSATPPFEQVRDGIVAQVSSGVLVPGFRLPPVRALATTLGIAANTVARAYRELETAGVVDTRGRAGTFVAGPGSERTVRQAAMTYVDAARALGLSDDEVLAHVQRAMGRGVGGA